MTRKLDIVFALAGLTLSAPLQVLLLVIGWFDTGAPLYRQVRVGRYQKPFTLLKFRTMHVGTAAVATHLADANAVTRVGKLLRRIKLDELPQLWNVLKGEMSLVGPRPCLFNQQGLIAAREARGLYGFRPGITGMAQIQGIDMSTPELLAKTDAIMLKDLNAATYFTCIIKTVAGLGRGDCFTPQNQPDDKIL